jgi:transposase, IS5 family
MRKRFEQQNTLDATAIPEVKIDSRSRHQLPKLLSGLQYIFVTPHLNELVFSILEQEVLKDKKSTGRLGMSLWEILVLGCCRLNMDMDYDLLQELSNNHETLRGILGVHTKEVFYQGGKSYALQTLKDNVGLLDEQTLQRISEEVVKAGHELKKNASEEVFNLELKSDTYCVESNIHFPTDLNLLWDSARKCLDVIGHITQHYKLSGWRKQRVWYRKVKKLYRRSANIHQRRGANYKERLHRAVRDYLELSVSLSVRVESTLADLTVAPINDVMLVALIELLVYYHDFLNKHVDLVERRILKGEQIPHSEKVFSIFEPHVEWIQKGKQGNKVELGHNVLITSDQFHFIVDHEVVIGQTDKALPIVLAKRLEKRFTDKYSLDSISFDRGFYSALAKKALADIFNQVVMPKAGKKTAEQEVDEAEENFAVKRRKHSAVESNINELEHSGANKVPDKGLDGFKKYVAWSVLAYNLKRLGNIVLQERILDTAIKTDNIGKQAA